MLYLPLPLHGSTIRFGTEGLAVPSADPQHVECQGTRDFASWASIFSTEDPLSFESQEQIIRGNDRKAAKKRFGAS